ncbi:Na(+)/H(+) antiporter subunit F1 [Priestia filamentosa]|jgi:multicomponent Na+:H+ antiporter subunit F|uniref:Na(+)/H(+) antiporter subunit F n=1 Tax=Priestia endophytica TaxID=135735 RepID=A0AAX1Q934_9BACI|nr:MULTISPECIES: Na(+)/H(+) antiporter subunit F1 [Priestia]MCM3540048.1 Na(+)/H(+) antiporter subunit F1 [Priestia endophytica]MCY8231599.1 Na(+)/H(+) antiporter subunit F1 [Priestia endophytica]MED3724823.1 Na(+)/H(+) antiporter subunit F1 [Priestia filamentosa]MED4071148.1 Na(+)/H(+) antiporter subunit F1 [Priestia endophytica]RAS74667.1 Na(+)/H(+) antiporter subunit F [Priestia endophytica]
MTLDILTTIALIILSLATIGLLYRVVKGPGISDRVMALDAIGINLMAITGITCIIVDTDAFLDIILLIGILAFIGTVAFAKFLERGAIIDHDRDS